MIVRDLLGQRFGKLTVLKKSTQKSFDGRSLWECQCECGNKASALTTRLLLGQKRSCGCLKGNPLSLIGKRFGKLTVTDRLRTRIHRYVVWECFCECGTRKHIKTNELTNGSVKSCGCSQFTKGSRNPLWRGHGEISGKLWARIARSAKTRNIPFELSLEMAWGLFQQQSNRCALSGMPISLKDGTASLDRRNSQEGYILENVQWVHKHINIMKMDHTEDEFIRLCKQVANHSK